MRRSANPLPTPLLALLPLALSCAEPPKPVRGDAPLRYSADWAGVVAFTEDACVGCHAAGQSAEGIPLPLALHVDRVQQTGRWVLPNDPEGSMLWRVLSGEGVEGDGAVMPQGSGPLDPEWTEHVRLWILDGAKVPPLALDNDGDGFLDDVDCDDADPLIHPAAEEVCDGVDNDCNGQVDGADATEAVVYYRDGDGDGFGADSDTVADCAQPAGYVPAAGDCDDSDPATHPSAPEDCFAGVDVNCDGATGTEDNDGDGVVACEDCNDFDAGFFPGAEEVCDGLDQDCDGEVDDDPVDGDLWWPDADGDGFGDETRAAFPHCTGTTGWVMDDQDCDDGDGAIHPGVLDVQDGVDNDCDGTVDEDAGAVPSHAVDIQPIWDAECLGACHAGFLPSDGMDLSGNGYAELVGVASNDVAGMARVEPGDPANSYLWHKLNNTHLGVGGSGSRMPKGGAQGLSAPELALVEAWILGGALP